MSDILLSVGLQKGSVETSQIQSDLQDIISRIDKNPPKVKVGLQVDQSAINHFKSQLTQIVNSVSLSSGAPITVNISGIGEITAQATKAQKALDGVAKSGKQAATAINQMNGKQSADALTKINNLLIQLQGNYTKWTAAQSGSASAAYTTYGNQINALTELKEKVEANALTAEEFAEQLSNIRAQATEAAAAIKAMGEDHAAASVEKLIRGSEEYNTALGKTENLLAQVKKRQEDWTAAKTGKSSSAYRDLAAYQLEIEELLSQLTSGKLTAENFADAFAKIQAKVKAAEGTIKSAGENTKTLGDKLKGLADKFGAWLSVSQVIMQAIRAIKQMVTAVREIDSAMTELKKVTNETDATYTKFLENASSRAKNLGAAISDVVTATADFARLGFSIDDASTLADTALIYKNIGDGIDDITTASESIISTMQAFGIEASDAMSIVDKFNEVGNNFAISSAGIGEAMQRSAAAMASANNTIDETIALITAANTIVQNPESVGTTLKTVSMYLRAAKTEAEEAGESTDGMANSVSELRQEILDLTGQRVDIQIDEDNFKSTYQILQELSEVWDSLTDITQANLLEMIGGKRNSNVVSALLENFSVAEDALKSSMESAGSAMEENEKHLDSINGKIEIFKATFEELATNFINSDFVKGVVDFGTGLLEVLNVVAKLVDALGGLNTILYVTVSLIAISKYQSILSFLSKVGGSILKVVGNIGTFNSAFAKLKSQGVGSLNALGQSLNQVGVSASKTQIILTAIVAVIGVAVSAYNKWKQAQEEARQEAISNAEAAAELSDEVSSLTMQYITLSEAVKTDESAKESLIETQDALIDKLGLEQYELDQLIEKYGSLSDAVLQASLQELETAEIKLKAGVDAQAEELYDAVGSNRRDTYEHTNNYVQGRGIGYYSEGSLFPSDEDYEKYYKHARDMKAAFEALQEAGYLGSNASGTKLTNFKGEDLGFSDVTLDLDFDLSTVDGIIAAHEQLREMLTLVDDVAGDNNAIYDYLEEDYLALSDAVANYTDSVGSLNSNLAQQYVVQGLIGAEIPDTKEEFDTYRQSVIDAAVASGEFAGTTEEIGSAIDGVLKADASFSKFYTEVIDASKEMRQAIVDAVAPKDYEQYTPGTMAHFRGLEEYTAKVAEYQAELQDLSDEELEFVYDLVINGDIDSWDELVAKLEWFNSAAGKAEMSWDTYSEQLSSILASGNLSTISSELTTLTNAMTSLSQGSMGVEDVVSLIQQFPELAEYVDFTADNFGNLEDGLKELIKNSPKEFVDTLQEFKETNNLTGEAAEQIDALCESVNNLSTEAIKDASGEFGVLAEAINAAKTAQTELEAALAEEDWDSGYEGRVSAFEGFQEVFDAGEYGSKAYAAYKEYFGLMEKTPAQVKAWMESNAKYFTEGTDGVLHFLETVEALSGPGGALEGIASFDSGTGAFWYDINQLSAFADELGWTEEMLQDFIYKYRMYVEEWTSRSAQDNLTEFTNAGLVFDIGDETFASLEKLIEYTGLSTEEIQGLVTAMNELREQQGLEPIQLIGSDQITITQATIDNLLTAGATAEDVKTLLTELAGQDNVTIEAGITLEGQTLEEIIAEATGDGTESVSVDITMSVNDEELLTTVTTTVEQMKAILGEDWETKLTADSTNAEERIAAVDTLLQELPEDTLVTVSDSTYGVRSNLSSVKSYLQYISNNSTKTITIKYRSIGSPVAMNATGTRHATQGPSLLGDEYSADGSPKPELVVSNGRAYLAGQNGPEIGYLNEGDIVYNATETKRILRGNILHSSIQAHAGGTANGLFDNGSIGGYQNYNYSGNTSSSSSSSSSSKSKSSSDEEESWFEKQYKYHQHLLAMDQESVAAYLDWLDDAYKKAYKEGVIDLDEYYKYQEEVYQGIQDLFKDHLSDIDHEISMLEGAVGSSDEVIALAQKAMADIEKELAAARAAGLDENNDYIQYLEQQWKGYSETVTDLREQAETDAENAVDNLVDYRIKMLKQDIQNEKDALNKKLDYLSDFYSKQREMLQDQYDEEKYLEEQSEKRKSVSDIQSELDMLKYDDSAWAQKRKLELQEELTTAQKDLADFEKEYALDNTLDLLEEQQKAQEAQIQAEMEALDAKLNDPEALFNQALSDIKNNTEQLYQEFLEYNRKYGTGNDEDVEEMWEEAYKADQEYQDTHNGESKDGIEIGNYTGYTAPEPATPPTSSTSTPSTTTPSTSTTTSAPSLTKGSYVEVKSGTKWYADSYGGGSWGRAKAGTIKYINTKGSHPYNIDGLGWVKKSDIVGYATGTDNATPGWHELFEGNEDEYIFTSGDGSKYRMFSGLGDKVLNPDATDFLYDFATTGGEFLSNMFSELMKLVGLDKLSKPTQLVQLSTGDIIVQGNADKQTVSEIRRMQRSETDRLLKEFNRLNK